MDTVNVNGIAYRKASLLAKEFKYTSDYLGQLCRARKVDCQLIGRSWYINPGSLVNHKNSRYLKENNLPNKKTFKYNVEINKSRINVEPHLKNNVIKILDSKTKNFNNRINWKPVKYEPDEGDLLPAMVEKDARIKIDLAGAKKLKVQGSDTKVEMRTDELPVVALKGGIEVSSLDYEYEIDEDILDKKNIDFINEIEESRGIKAEKKHLIINNEKHDLSKEEFPKFDLIPKKITQGEKKDKNLKVKKNISLFLLILLTVVLLLTVFVEREISFSSETYDTSLKFSPVNL